jgi:hypothetical protein
MATFTPSEGRITEKRSYFPWISWGAIFGGLASGMGTYLLLALLGLAAGLTAINPQAAEPMGKAPLITGIWTSISLVLSAFVGGYVAARMSGLSRLADGMLHGLVAWSVSTLVFAFAITTSVGSMLGGAFSILGQGAKAAAGGAAVTAGGVSGSQGAQTQLESLLKGSSGKGEISKASMSNLQSKLSSGDRDGAINVMVSEMGFTRDRAETMVDQGMALFGSVRNLPQQAEQAASSAVSGLTKVSWGLFAGVLLSMALGIFGGAVGAKAAVKRRNPRLHHA